jgi:HPt (histidine-containing phosphotransfer) domain-containing protein
LGEVADLGDLLASLRTIASLDVDLGLQRTTNNPAFYATLLRKFVASQEDAIERVRQALQEQDRASAERHAHTLKGVASNLGAGPVQRAAEELESALRQGSAEPVVQKHIARTAQQLGDLVQALKAAPGLMETRVALKAHDLSQADKDAAFQVVGQIRALLAQDDAHAGELWESNARVLRALYAKATQIEAAINGFDYEEALELLTESA